MSLELDMNKINGLKIFDPSEYLVDDESINFYLDEALKDDDPRILKAVFGAIAKAKGINQLAKETGIKREQIYKIFSGEDNPAVETLSKILAALNLKASAKMKKDAA